MHAWIWWHFVQCCFILCLWVSCLPSLVPRYLWPFPSPEYFLPAPPPSPFTGLWPVWYLICVSCLPVAWPFPLCSLPFFSARLILSGASLPPMFGVRCFLITAPWLSPSLFNPLLVQSPDPSSVMPLCLQCLTWLSFGMSFVLSVLCFLFSRSSFPLHRMLRMSAPSFQMFQYSISGALVFSALSFSYSVHRNC